MHVSISLGELCRQFFDAVERRDRDALSLLIAPGAVRSQNGKNEVPLAVPSESQAPRSRAVGLGKFRYEQIRQVIGEQAVTEQHRVRSVRPDGSLIDADVCVVMLFDENGRVVRLDEYFNPEEFLPRD
jgi:ketosteroid isomerase-like protein